MTPLAELGSWWTATILPWAIDSTLAGLVLFGIARLTRKKSPALSRVIAGLGLVKMVLPPFLLPVGLISFGVTDPSGVTLAPLGAPLAGSLIGVIGAIHLIGVGVALLLLAHRVFELHRLIRTAHLITDPGVLRLVTGLAAQVGHRSSKSTLCSGRRNRIRSCRCGRAARSHRRPGEVPAVSRVLICNRQSPLMMRCEASSVSR